MSDEQRKHLEASIREALRSKQWAVGLELTDQWCRQYPTNAAGWYWRSGCLMSLNRWAEALGCARKAAGLAPGDERVAKLVKRLEKRLTPTAPRSAPVPLEQRAPAEPARSADQPAEHQASSEPPLPPVPSSPPAPPLPEQRQPVTLRDPEAGAMDPQGSPGPPEADAASEPAAADRRSPGVGGVAAPPATIDDPRAAPEPPRLETAPADVLGPDVRPMAPAAEIDAAAPISVQTPTQPAQMRMWSEGALIEERYEVRKVARGGMGEVYFVFDRELGLMIAVKTPLPETLTSAAGRARFFREAEAWIALGLHPNICAAFYVREIGGLPRLFIDYVEGGSLAEWLRENRVSDPRQCLDLAIQIAAGMHHAHTFSWQDEDGNERRGLVHRDLKPANVLLTPQLEARVTDFGLVGRGEESDDAAGEPGLLIEPAGALDPGQAADSLTRSVWGTMTVGGVALGTPPYMPPEQWLGAHHAGRPADVYAFGCILFEMLCGRRPIMPDPSFANALPEAVLMEWRRLHCEVEPPDAAAVDPTLDPRVAAMIARCLAKDPEARPTGFDEIGQELRDAYQRLVGAPYPREEPKPGRLLAGSLNNRGVSFMALDQSHRAELAWRQALAADPHHIEATYNLALFEWRYRGLADHDVMARMDEVRRTQLALWRDDHLAAKLQLLLGAHGEALESLGLLLGGTGAIVPDVRRDAALAAAAVARYSGEPEAWAQVLEIVGSEAAKGDPALLTARASALAEQTELEQARQEYDQARSLREGLPEALSLGAATLVPGQSLVRRTGGFGGRAQSVTVSDDGHIALLRGDEGRFTIYDLARGEVVRTYRNPTGKPLRSIAIDASGSHAMTVAEGEPVQVWRLEVGAPVRRLQLHAGYINAMTTSPGCGRVAAVGSDGGLNVWDYASGKRLLTFRAHDGFGLCVALAGDQRTVITGGSDTVIKVSQISDQAAPAPPGAAAEAQGQQAVRAVLSGHTASVTSLAVDASSSWLLSGAENGELRLWDLRQMTCRKVLGGHAGAILWLAMDPAMERAVSVAADGVMRLWSLGLGEPVTGLRFNGQLMGAAGTADLGSVVVVHGSEMSQLDLRVIPELRPSWAVAVPVSVTEAEQRETEFRARLGSARSLAAEQNLRGAFETVEAARQVSGYERDAEAVELSESLAACFPRLRLSSAWETVCFNGHQGRVNAAAMVEGGRTAISVGMDRSVLQWDWGSGEIVRELSRGGAAECALAVAPGGAKALSATIEHSLRLWTLHDGRCSATILGHEAPINDLSISPKGAHAAAASADETTRVWDLVTGGYTAVLEGHLAPVSAVGWSPDGETVATAAVNGTVILWNPRTGASIRTFNGNAGRVMALAWFGTGRRVVTASADGSIRLWDPETGECRQRFEQPGEIFSAVAVAPDDEFILSGSEQGIVRLWKVAAGTEERSFTAHSGAITSVGFSENGFRAFSASADGAVRIWYLDWEIEACDPADWDERARGWLEVFVKLHSMPSLDGAQPKVRWARQDLERLLASLRQRGLGWLRADGVQAELRRMAGAIAADRPARAQVAMPTTTVVTPRHVRQRRLLTRVAIGVLLALIPVALIGQRAIDRSRLRVEKRQVEKAKATIRQSVHPLRQMAYGRFACNRSEHDAYLDAFLVQGTSIRYDTQEAMICLAMVGDTRTVRPLLDSLRPRDRELRLDGARDAFGAGRYGDVGSILAHLDESTVAVQARALNDPEPAIRKVVAAALVARGSRQAIEALIANGFNEDSQTREAIAAQFMEIVASEVLSADEALELAQRWARDSSAEVRRSIAAEMVILAGSRAEALVSILMNDPEEKVRAAAARTMKGYR